LRIEWPILATGEIEQCVMGQIQEDIEAVDHGKAGVGKRVGVIERRRLRMDRGEIGDAVDEDALVG
jgi:hypothetical protein